MRSVLIAVLVLVLSLQGFSAVKKLLFEEFNGAFCVGCPGTQITLDNFVALYPNKVHMVHEHYGDAMYNRFFDSLVTPGSMMLGKMYVNRRTKTTVYVTDSLLAAIGNELKTAPTSPVAVGITSTWDNSTRKITGTITIKFESAPTPGDLRAGLIIVEDNVVGTGAGYDQANLYNDSSKYPELKGAGNPIIGYTHHMVQRDYPLDGVFGKSGNLPSSLKVDTVYSVPFTYTVPVQYPVHPRYQEKFKPVDVVTSSLYLVAFVGYYKGAVLNSERVKVVIQPTSVSPTASPANRSAMPAIRSYRDHISFSMPQRGMYDVALVSPAGRVVFAMPGVQLGGRADAVSISTGKLPSGVYVLTARGMASGTATRVYVGR